MTHSMAKGNHLAVEVIDDLEGCLFSLPSHGEPVSPRDALDKGLGSHRPCDGDAPEIVGQIKHTVAVFEPRHVLTDERGVGQPFTQNSHTGPSTCTTEQSDSEGFILNECNPVTGVNPVNSVTVSFGHSVAANDDPANDNIPLDDAA